MNYKPLILSILFTFTLFNFSFSQKEKIKEIDSIIDAYENSSSVINGVESMEYVDSLSSAIKYYPGIVYSNLYFFSLYRDRNKEVVEPYLFKIENIIHNDLYEISSSDLIYFHLFKGYYKGLQNQNQEELRNYKIADSIVETSGLIDHKFNVNQHLSSYYVANKNFNQALKLHKKNLAVLKQIPETDSYNELSTIANIGIIFKYSKEYDSAIVYLQKAINLGLGNYEDIEFQYLTLAECYLNTKRHDSAKKYLSLLKNTNTNQCNLDIVWLKMAWGEYYLQANILDSARINYASALSCSKKINWYNGIDRCSKSLLKINFKLNKDKEALSYFKDYLKASDSIYRRETIKREQDIIFENKIFKKEFKIKELKLKSKNEANQFWLIISILLIALLLLLYLISKFKSRQTNLRQKLKIETLEKNQIQRDLNHQKNELSDKIELLKETNQKLKEISQKFSSSTSMESIIESLDSNYINDTQWKQIIHQFGIIFPDLMAKISKNTPKLTQNDLRLLILIKMDYPNKTMSEVLNISLEGVKKAKQRLKKKFDFSEIVNK